MSVENVVSAKVQLNTSAADPADFSKALIAGYHTKNADLQRTYTSLTGLTDDGFAVGDPIYEAAEAMIANGYSGEFAVGRLASPYTESYNLIPANVIENQSYSLKITAPNGVAATVTHAATAVDTVETVIDALVILIDALGLDITLTDNTTSLDIVADNAGEHFCVDVLSRFENLQFKDNTPSPATLSAELDAIDAIDEDFYAIVLDRASAAQITVLAAWASTRRKLAFYASSDYDATTALATDIASLLNLAGQERTTGFWAEAMCDHAEAAWVGVIMSANPGVRDSIYKTMVGVTRTGRLTSNMRKNLSDKNLTYFEKCGSDGRTLDADGGGRVASGQYVDIRRGTDWYVNLSQVNLANAILSNDLPYTNPSVEVLKGVQRSTNNFAVGRGFLDADHTVTAPTVEQIPAATREARCFGDINVKARYAGKIRKVEDLVLNLSF